MPFSPIQDELLKTISAAHEIENVMFRVGMKLADECGVSAATMQRIKTLSSIQATTFIVALDGITSEERAMNNGKQTPDASR